MLNNCLFIILYMLYVPFSYAQSDHAEATGYIDYFIATYNSQEIKENDLIISQGAFINNNDVFIDYKVNSTSDSILNNKKELFNFIEKSISKDIGSDSFELQVFAINYNLVICYYFEDEYCLIVEKKPNEKIMAKYYDKDHNIIKKVRL